MTRRQLMLRLAPMLLVSLFTSTHGVVLPRLIDFFNLSLSEAGYLVASMRSAGFVSMVIAGIFMDRVGPVPILIWCFVAFGISGFAVSLSAGLILVVVSLWILSMGSALTAVSINTLMAQTGERRAFYLGMMHSTFSFVSIGAPVVAGVVVVQATWQVYYGLVGVLSVLIGWVFWKCEVPHAGKSSPRSQGKGEDLRVQPERDESIRTPVSRGMRAAIVENWGFLRDIWPLCLGIFCMVGVQGTLATWSYLYVVEVYAVSHGFATMATALFWTGILVGRVGSIPVSSLYSERAILTAANIFSIVFLGLEQLVPTVWVAVIVLVFFGIGVSGAFQLGTAWATGIIPHRVGAASSFVMASAALGGTLWPSLSGVLADHFSFSSLPFILLAGFLLAAAAFTAAPRVAVSRSVQVH